MYRFKKDIITILAITISYTSITSANTTLKNHDKCIRDMTSVFGRKLINHFGLEIPLRHCLQHIITDIAIKDIPNDDIRNYLVQVAQIASKSRSGIKEPKAFCYDQVFEITVEIEQKYDEENRCIEELKIFGSSIDTILNKAIYKHSLEDIKEDTKFYDWYMNSSEGTHRYAYLHHIARFIKLQENAQLDNPKQYCTEKYPVVKVESAESSNGRVLRNRKVKEEQNN